jgi:hypothetical protein
MPFGLEAMLAISNGLLLKERPGAIAAFFTCYDDHQERVTSTLSKVYRGFILCAYATARSVPICFPDSPRDVRTGRVQIQSEMGT